MYNRQDLVNAVKTFAQNVYNECCNDAEITSVDIRLQLVDGSYELHSGHNSFDTDHRGYWGCGCVVIREELEDLEDNEEVLELELEDENDYDQIAVEIVTEAINDLLENDEDYKDVYNITPIETCKVRELSDDLEFTDNSENINSVLEHISISDLDDEIESLYWEYCDGEIGEVWYLKSNACALNEIAYRIR